MVNNLPANAGDITDLSSTLGLGRSPGGGHAPHSSVLAWRIPTARGAWWATVHGVAKSWTGLKGLSNQALHDSFTFLNLPIHKLNIYINIYLHLSNLYISL